MRRSDVFSALSEDDMEEELEKTKIVRAFWDLRQEVCKATNFIFTKRIALKSFLFGLFSWLLTEPL